MQEEEIPETKRKQAFVRRIVILCALVLGGVVISTQLAPRFLLPQAPLPVAEVVPQEPAAPESVQDAGVMPPTFSPPEDAAATPAPAAEAPSAPPAEATATESAKLALSGETVRLLDAQLKDHERQLAALKAEQDAAWKTVALLNAFDRLKDAATSGRPFTQEFASMQQLAARSDEANEALTRIEPFAGHGIPQLAFLKADFEASVRPALAAEFRANDGFFARLRANLSQLITVRKIGAQPGNAPDAVIGRAEEALKRDDVAAAAQEVQTLTGAPARAFVAWLSHARAYTALAPALGALKTSILAAERAPEPKAEAAE